MTVPSLQCCARVTKSEYAKFLVSGAELTLDKC